MEWILTISQGLTFICWSTSLILKKKKMDRNCNKNFIGHITVFLWPWTAEFVVYRPVILIWIFLGINFVLRKVGNSITSYEEIKQDGDNWELNITSTFKNAHLKFKLGEEFDETTLDGRKCKVSKGKKKMHSST